MYAKLSLAYLAGVIESTMNVDTWYSGANVSLLHQNSPLREVIAVNDIAAVVNKLTSYTKFTFVRHPFVRLVSGYFSKFTVARYPH